jgi:beta-phosphoglucomutase-like phosphatase (HAD superfamily)
MPGLLKLISTVQAQGVLLAAVTNAPRPNVEFMLRLFGLASEDQPLTHDGSSGRSGRLDTIVLGEDCREAKPSPEAYLLAMERLSVRPEQCIVFEDSDSGATAGVRSGAVVVGVLTTKSEEHMRRLGCQYVINDYTQIDIDKMMREMRDFVRQP